MIASMRDFIGVIVFHSIISLRNFTRVRKKCDLSGTAFLFFLSSIWWYLSNTLNSSCFVCECMKKSSKFVKS